MTADISLGSSAHREHLVSEQDSAISLGSGSVPVLATPRLVAWLEAAAVSAISDTLPIGSTSVGTHIELHHLAATPLGRRVAVSAVVVAVDGRMVDFTIKATEGNERPVAEGTHRRAVVDTDRFLARL